MTVEYKLEDWFIIKGEMIPLVKAHWDGFNKDKREEFNISEDQYDAMALGRLLHITTARDNGVLIGYVASIVMPNINAQHVVCSYESGWYVKPEARKGGIGIKIRIEAEKNLKGLGVNKMFAAIPANTNLAGIMDRLGWQEAEIHYSKWIGE